jgi:DNA polymerase I
MVKTKFIPIDYDYFDWEDKNWIRIIGRDDKGKRVCIIDSCPIYLWAILKEGVNEKEIKKLITGIEHLEIEKKDRTTKIEKIELHEKNFLSKKVKALKIFATNHKDLHAIAGELDFLEIDKRRGYDIGLVTHYIIEKKLKPLEWYEIEGRLLNNSNEFGGIDMALEVDFVYELIKHSPLKDEIKFNPKIMAYDIECDEIKIGEGEIVMISLVSNTGLNKVITYKKNNDEQPDKAPEFVEYVKDEAELIERFIEITKEQSPDFLVGYFSDGFDMPYLKARAEKLKVKLSLGLDGTQPRFTRGINLTARISGLVHIDLLKFIRTAYSQYMQSETLSLNEVASEFLGERKLEHKHKHSSKIEGHDWNHYYEYNLRDSQLVVGLFEKMWTDILGFSKVIQEPVFEVTRNGMSKNVESYILHNLENYNEIPEKRPMNQEISERRYKEKYEGAFVFEPIPGLYEDLAMFDFTSSYGSVIVSYNLSKSTFKGNEKEFKGNEKDFYSITTGGEKIFFSKETGFVPDMLREIIKKRKEFKKELSLSKNEDTLKKARSNAYKLLANAYYGYQGFFGARYYCREAAAATAAFAKKSIQDAITEINKSGFKTIYSDTDSIAFLLNKKSQTETLEFLKEINSKLPGIMELELEGFFKRGIWVTTRSGTAGAKKKYALISKEGKLKIRGFETVRRDWCKLSRVLQNKVIQMILEDGNEKRALKYSKEIIQKIKEREINKEELMIRTQLKKPLSEYKSISPHVVAAKKMIEQEIPISIGNLIEYYISQPPPNSKKKLVRDRVKLPEEKGEYDIEYYLNNQILPAIENIFNVLKINTKELIDGKKQTTLGDF